MCSSSGKVPKAGSTVHTIATSTKPSRGCSSRWRRRLASRSASPLRKVINMASAWSPSAPSAITHEKPIGTSIDRQKKINTMPGTGTTAAMLRMDGLEEEGGADLEQLFHLAHLALARHEDDDVVVALDHSVVVRNDHLARGGDFVVAFAGLAAAHDGADLRPARKGDLVDAPAHHA